jgi:hypothetical protein
MRMLILFLLYPLFALPAFGQATGVGQCDGCTQQEAAASVEFEVGPGDYVYENDPGCDGDTGAAIARKRVRKQPSTGH